MSEPAFIPRDQIVPGIRYPNYVGFSDGLRHKRALGWSGSQTTGTFRYSTAPVDTATFDVKPNRRRTPAQRTESLASAIQYHLEKYGWSDSLEDELLRMSWVNGKPVSRERLRELARHRLGPDGSPLTAEDARRLAAFKLDEAEKNVEEENRKRVTRRSPYVLDTS
mgnify:CR=1 FL=1